MIKQIRKLASTSFPQLAFFPTFFWLDLYFLQLYQLEAIIAKAAVFQCLLSIILDLIVEDKGNQEFTVLRYLLECI